MADPIFRGVKSVMFVAGDDAAAKPKVIELVAALGDTATQIALIAISVGVSGSVPFIYVLMMPLLFTAGMVTIDTSDGVSMRCAYGWAFLKPIRKIYYNLTITIISVLVAFAIGGIELIQVISSELGWTSGFWGFLATLDFETMGYFIIAIFLISWLVAMAYYRYKGYEKNAFPAKTTTLSGDAAAQDTSHLVNVNASSPERPDKHWLSS
jgi:high-affinity nickel-transport protein